ncbi:hypothetical protein EQ831_18385 [Pseudomonas sp. ALS1279]|nr:hypothetical protein [Pseudomonas sp. ALS1279]TRO33936.1 hypothetical protein EQ831_18385 [Pseudomonas sp. ALS1279]
MKADMDDMPEYLKTRKKDSPWRMVAIMAIGTGVVVGGLSLFGGGFIESAKKIASGDGLRDDIGLLQPQPKQQESARPQGAVARRETYTPPQTLRTDEPLVIERGGAYDSKPTQPERQTVFNDQNYRPQGAANVVRFNAPVIVSEERETKTPKQQEIVIVGQEQKPGDWVCSYIGGEGSLDRRHCKSSMQLQKRNQSYSGNRSP